MARQIIFSPVPGKLADQRSARRALAMGIACVNITQDVRKYPTEQGVTEKSKKFAEAGGEVYAKA